MTVSTAVLLLKVSTILLFIGTASAWDVARTPPQGFNSWNLYHCGISATVLTDTAQAMHDSGLQAAGYEYVSTDDCWMNAARGPAGEQVPQPAKFPHGFKPVADFIHGLGLKSGLYTAKGPNTCAKFAASCNHEIQDAAQWASWGIDLVKDDSCSVCANYTDDAIYHRMWEAIEASGRPMVLMVEGQPTDSLITLGGYGNSKRVGHDISPVWQSMTSLVDIGAGLWMYAHNSTNATFGGWWNDLDMIEVGNKPDFDCGADSAALARCQAHFTQWTIMKAPLILGNDIPNMNNETLAVLSNADAIAINQDALGIQARRVYSNSSLPRSPAELAAYLASPAFHSVALAPCDALSSTQAWALSFDGTLRMRTGGSEWCLKAFREEEEGGWGVVDCAVTRGTILKVARVGGGGGDGSVSIAVAASGRTLTFNNDASASGPQAHMRYIAASDTTDTQARLSLSPSWSPLSEDGATFTPLSVRAPSSGIIDIDEFGTVRVASNPYCLDVAPSLTTEVWAGPLTGGRWAISLFNRQANASSITAAWSMFNVSASTNFNVRDVWAKADKGQATGSITAIVPSQAVAYYILSPA